MVVWPVNTDTAHAAVEVKVLFKPSLKIKEDKTLNRCGDCE
jgi:hypothetical protein